MMICHLLHLHNGALIVSITLYLVAAVLFTVLWITHWCQNQIIRCTLLSCTGGLKEEDTWRLQVSCKWTDIFWVKIIWCHSKRNNSLKRAVTLLSLAKRYIWAMQLYSIGYIYRKAEFFHQSRNRIMLLRSFLEYILVVTLEGIKFLSLGVDNMYSFYIIYLYIAVFVCVLVTYTVKRSFPISQGTGSCLWGAFWNICWWWLWRASNLEPWGW